MSNSWATKIPPVPHFPDGFHYHWSQSDSQVTVTFLVPANLTAKNITAEFKEDSVTVSVSNEPTPRLHGRLMATVKKSQCLWTIESLASTVPGFTNRYKQVTVILEKATQKNEWGIVVLSGIKSSEDADPHSLYLIASARHEMDDPLSLKLMKEAAEKGSVAAMLKLAAWYELGREELPSIPVAKNPLTALDYHRKAADLGSSEACYIVMSAYASGSHGVPLSYADAIRWGRESMSYAGGPDVMAVEQPKLFITIAFQSGLMLMEGGHGLGNPNPMAAVVFWQQSANMGHGPSLWNLGIFLINGFAGKLDIAEGVSYIRRGMKLSPELGLPPQLKGLSQADLDELIEIEKQWKKDGSPIAIDELISALNSKKKADKKAAKRKNCYLYSARLLCTNIEVETNTSPPFSISNNFWIH
jgi:TPR repeat protein